MQWQDLIGHDRLKEWFQVAVRNGRLGSSFLFVGPSGIGKRAFARLLAKGLLCQQTASDNIEACGVCEACVQVEAGTHPDLIQVAKPPDRAFLPIELLIGEREKRMREGLCHDISLRPTYGGRKIAILDDADALNVEGANCLLKTLEEPPSGSILILIGTSLQRQLPTIRSRCQALLFRPLSPEQLKQLLLRLGLAASPEQSQELAERCGGSLDEAHLLAEPEMAEFQLWLNATLSQTQWPLIELSKHCGAIVDAAGKDARVKRERLKLIFRMAAAYFREVVVMESQRTSDVEPSMVATPDGDLTRRTTDWKTGLQGATHAWQCCLQSMEYVDRNANQAALLENWSADIARYSGR
jgi:DNA polymerase-3 subunit delta'